MQGHVCNHANGKSHICGCKMEGSSHHAMQTGCTLFGGTGRVGQVEPGSENTAFVKVVHTYQPSNLEGRGGCSQCGEIREHRLHPHIFQQGDEMYNYCRCGASRRSLMHQMTSI